MMVFTIASVLVNGKQVEYQKNLHECLVFNIMSMFSLWHSDQDGAWPFGFEVQVSVT